MSINESRETLFVIPSLEKLIPYKEVSDVLWKQRCMSVEVTLFSLRVIEKVHV